MDIEEHSALHPLQTRPTTTTSALRIRERIRRHEFNQKAERPTLACSIVYFTTIAFLVAMCVEAAFR